jgi:rhamnulokinase
LEHLLGRRFETLHITGGGGKNQFLNALTANAIARPVLVGPIEGTALGNLLMQMKAKGEIKSIEEGRQLIKESFPLQEVLPNDSI